FHVPSPIAETNPLQQSCPFDTRGSARNWLPVHKMDAPQGRQNNSPWPTSHRVPPLRSAAPVSESSRTPENLSEPGHLFFAGKRPLWPETRHRLDIPHGRASDIYYYTCGQFSPQERYFSPESRPLPVRNNSRSRTIPLFSRLPEW